MKKKNYIKKEVKRIKKTKDLIGNKRRKQRQPDLWKEIRSNLKPLGKAYNKFREKRRILKQKEEERRLKEQEEQRLREEAALKLYQQEERRFKKEEKIKEEKERILKEQEKQRLEKKRIKEEHEEQIRQEEVYKARLIKGEEERIKQLKIVNELREEERKLLEERRLKEEDQRLKDEDQRLKKQEHKLKKEEIINSKEGRRLDDEQNKKKLYGTVKWFNDSKGYGFIKREDNEKDVFVHSSAVQNSGLKYLKKDEQLTFEIEHSDKGPSAVNLQKTVNEVSRSHLKLIK